MFCGTTWTKGAIYGGKALSYGLKAIKTALQSTKPLSSATKIVDASKAASTATKLFQKIHNTGAPFPGTSSNRALFEEYKTGLRTNMEKPFVYDSELKAMVEKNYRANGKIGNGSTAAVIRYEISNGSQVCDKFHTIKGHNSITFYKKWLKNNPTAGQADRAAAENILKDLCNSLGK
jgi:hypothetical protein